ncbi:hypothetical protein HQ496_05135, partial [bacterium]|nr:hypothetical protein [bacterium]
MSKALFPLVLIASVFIAGCGEKQPPAAHSNLQLQDGQRAGIDIVASFDGIGVGFEGPQGTSQQRNPSDNSLAVGPDHIIQTVNTRTAIFTKKGAKYGETGRALYGPVGNNNFFKGFGGACEETNNGDTVVTFDQLANRWLVVMPIFRRLPKRANEPAVPTPADGPVLSTPGNENQPGAAATLFHPEALTEEEVAAAMAAQQAERER